MNSGRFQKGQRSHNSRDWSEIDLKIRERYPAEGVVIASELGISRNVLWQRASKIHVRCNKKPEHTESSRKKISEALTGIHKDAAWREKLSSALKGRPHSAERLRRIAEGLRKSRQGSVKMTAPEKWAGDVLRLLFGQYSPYQFTGHRSLWIELLDGRQRNPDFAWPDEKKIIEVFGEYWHRGEDPQRLIDDYAAVGWRCMVVWENRYAGVVDDIHLFTYPYEFHYEMTKDFTCT